MLSWATQVESISEAEQDLSREGGWWGQHRGAIYYSLQAQALALFGVGEEEKLAPGVVLWFSFQCVEYIEGRWMRGACAL